MSGDYTRDSFRPRKRFAGVLMQQGRVQLDSDWNEEGEILRERLRLLSLDNFGPVGVPYLTTPDAFKLGLIAGPPLDLAIEPGRLYVDGLLAELFAGEAATYASQPFLPDPPPPPAGDSVAYLDVWEREVTYVEDPELLDVALGGVDTATRLQAVWQLRVDGVEQGGAECGMPVGPPPSAGRLTSKAIAPPAPDDPCILPPLQGYRGLENRLYRIEIHDGGALGVARFKWSRDNGALVAPVTDLTVGGGKTGLSVKRLGRDEIMRFRVGDWVTVTDDNRELHGEPGEMALIENINEADREILLDRALPTGGGRPFGAGPGPIAARHTRVQRWDQTAALNTLDGDGLLLTSAGPIAIEAGIEISLSMDPAGGEFRVGDYWQIWARTATAEIEALNAAPPKGIEHHYVQLAAISGLGGPAPAIEDCRPQPPAQGAGCCTFVVRPGESIQKAIDDLPPEGGCVCLKAGLHTIDKTIVIARSNVTLHGESMGAIVRHENGGIALLIGDMEDFGSREVRVSSIVFQQDAGEQGILGVVGLSRAERVVIADCRLEAGPGQFGIGLMVNDSADITVSGCVFTGAMIGAWSFGRSRNVTIAGCDFSPSDDPETLAAAGIIASEMAGPIVIEDNLVSTPLYGIAINDDLTGAPRSEARGSRVCGNRIRVTRRPDSPDRAVAIDVASEASIVNDNEIEHRGGNIAGIRLNGSGSAAHGNIIRCRRREESFLAAAPAPASEQAIAILAGHETDGLYLPLERLIVTHNIVEGAQHGILLGGVARARVSGNILGDGQVGNVNGIVLHRATDCILAENILSRHAFGFFMLAGARNTVSENRLDGGGAGIGVFMEEAPTISGNRLIDLDQNGIIVWVAGERCNLIGNRIVRCGAEAAIAYGIGAWGIFGELHVEANQVMDLGGQQVAGGPKRPPAYGIFGESVLEARIESNLVTYSSPTFRDMTGEDRAFLMRGLTDHVTDREATDGGYAVQISNNKFIGPGASHLVELVESPGPQRGQFLRFGRVLFHGNYCAHFSRPFAGGAPTTINLPAAPIMSTVKLVGHRCSVTGNHVRATTPGFPSYRLFDASLGPAGEMRGPFIGNVSHFGHSGRTPPAQMPNPESSFNA